MFFHGEHLPAFFAPPRKIWWGCANILRKNRIFSTVAAVMWRPHCWPRIRSQYPLMVIIPYTWGRPNLICNICPVFSCHASVDEFFAGKRNPTFRRKVLKKVLKFVHFSKISGNNVNSVESYSFGLEKHYLVLVPKCHDKPSNSKRIPSP